MSRGSAQIDGLKVICGLTGESEVIAGVALHLVAVDTHYNKRILRRALNCFYGGWGGWGAAVKNAFCGVKLVALSL